MSKKGKAKSKTAGRGFSAQYAATDKHQTVLFSGDHHDVAEYVATYNEAHEGGLFMRRMMWWELALDEEVVPA